MKKVLSLLLVLVMCFTLCACEPSSEDIMEKLQGTWTESTSIAGVPVTNVYAFLDDTFAYKCGIGYEEVTSETGTYTIQGNNIVLNFRNTSYDGKTIIPFKLNGDELIFNVDDEGKSNFVHRELD